MYPSYLVHFNPNHDPKTGQFAPGSSEKDSVKNKTKNYINTINSLSDDEFKLFTGDPNKSKKQDIELTKKLISVQEKYKDSIEFVSRNGNITMGNIDDSIVFGKQWKIGWATNPKVRGSGITQENIKEAIYLMKKYRDVPISAIIDPNNTASIKTAEKAGFFEVGDIYNPISNKMEKKYVYGEEDANKTRKAINDYIEEIKRRNG